MNNNIKKNPYEDITYEEFRLNPSGKGTAFFRSREVVKEDLERRTLMLIKYSKGSFQEKIYANKDLTEIIIHLKVPSEQKIIIDKKLLYDVVIELTNEEAAIKTFMSVAKYRIRFYSNSPDFQFTYTFSAKEHDLLPAFTISKCSQEALIQSAEKRNPDGIIGFNKSIFFALNYIQYKGLYRLNEIRRNRNDINYRTILDSIASMEEKFTEYNIIKRLNEDKKARINKADYGDTQKKQNSKKSNVVGARKARSGGKRITARKPKSLVKRK